MDLYQGEGRSNETYRATFIRTEAGLAVNLPKLLKWLTWHWRITRGRFFNVTLLGPYSPAHLGPLDDEGAELHVSVPNEPVEVVIRSWAEKGQGSLFVEVRWTGPSRAESQIGEPEAEVALLLGEVVEELESFLGGGAEERLTG